MTKRKRDDLADTMHMQPAQHADGEAAKPFTFCFSSKFDFKLDPNFTSKLYTHKEKEGQHIIHSSMDKADFVGKTYNDEYVGPLPCRYAIGVLDKATGKMQMIETEAGHLIRMHAWQPWKEESEKIQAARRASHKEGENLHHHFRSSRDKLNSAKKMRKAALRDRNKVKEDDLQDDPVAMRQLFDKAIAEREVANDPSKEELLRRAHERRIIPPHHLDATKPFDAYRLEELVSPDSYRALVDTVVKQLQQGIDDDEFREGVLRAKWMFPEYILDKLPIMKNMVSEAFQRRLKHLALVGVLMNMYEAPKTIRNDTKRAGGLNNMSNKLNIPVPILEFFLKTFYRCDWEGTIQVHGIPDNLKRLMWLYIIIVAVLAEDGEMSSDTFEKLRRPFKVDAVDVAEQLRELGCECNPAKAYYDGKTHKTFSVSLLPAKSGTPKTLQEYFPALKLGGRGRK